MAKKQEPLDICNECGFNYPAGIVTPMVSTHDIASRVCPICAKQLLEQMHGISDFEFANESNQEKYVKAVYYNKLIGRTAPKVVYGGKNKKDKDNSSSRKQ